MNLKQLYEKTNNGYNPFIADIKIKDIENLEDKLNDLQTAPIENSDIDGIFV